MNFSYYRLSQVKGQFPTHFSYIDAWTFESGEWVDNRSTGFQVWNELPRVVAVAAGNAVADGKYEACEYPWLHLIEAEDIKDGCDEWFAVEPEDVITVFAVSTASLTEWALAQWENSEQYEDDDFEDWCESNEEAINAWVQVNAEQINPRFVNTLPCPELAHA